MGYLHQQAIGSLFECCIHDLIADISQRASRSISNDDKKSFGAYYTPKALSMHMVDVANYSGGKLADQGAGAGILSALALVKHILSDSTKKASLDAFEIQESIHPYLKETMQTVEGFSLDMNTAKIKYNLHYDYLYHARSILASEHGKSDSAIQNPPYFKLAKKDPLNTLFRESLGFTVPNIYIAFVILALKDLKPNGTLTTLIPRSFMNGRYFKSARKHIKDIASVESITRFRSRSNLFKGDNIIQENVICHFRRAEQCKSIKVYTCEAPEQPPAAEMTIDAKTLLDNPNDVMILPADLKELEAFKLATSSGISLSDLGIGVSTGKVILHRFEGVNSKSIGVPLIEGKSFNSEHRIFTRKENANLPNAMAISDKVKPMLVAAEPRVLIKRISSNSDNKRMHVTCLLPEHTDFMPVALSNHIQYIYGLKKPLLKDEAELLADFLRSEVVELAMRCLSGTTQINVDDLSILRFPPLTN